MRTIASSQRIRVSIVGLGTVGQWLLRAIAAHRGELQARYGVELTIVGLASRRHGFVYHDQGIDVDRALSLVSTGASITEIEGAAHWPVALTGLEATDTDVLLEVSASPAAGGEPGLSHIRHALRRSIAVATSNKWPVALAGVELARLATDHGTGFRAESTVMSGTPLLVALTEGTAGAAPVRLRGIVNATVNYVCSRLADGADYRRAVLEAQAAGLAEPDPSADVDGFDSVAKLMVLSALVFGRQLEAGDVARRGISSVSEAEIASARSGGRRLREIMLLDPGNGRQSVSVEAVGPTDPLFDVDGAENAVIAELEPIGAIGIRGPGAGPKLAGQGVFSDLVALARRRAAAGNTA